MSKAEHTHCNNNQTSVHVASRCLYADMPEAYTEHTHRNNNKTSLYVTSNVTWNCIRKAYIEHTHRNNNQPSEVRVAIMLRWHVQGTRNLCKVHATLKSLRFLEVKDVHKNIASSLGCNI